MLGVYKCRHRPTAGSLKASLANILKQKVSLHPWWFATIGLTVGQTKIVTSVGNCPFLGGSVDGGSTVLPLSYNKVLNTTANYIKTSGYLYF